LLGGAVIGSVLDISGTYYNPGGLSLIADPDVFLAAKVFEYPQYTLKGAYIEDVELTSTNLGPAPSIVATMISAEWLGKHRLAISFFTRYDVKIDIGNTIVSDELDLPNIPDLDYFISDFRLNERLSDFWGGLTWSYKLSSKVGVGITNYFMSRTHRANVRTFNELIQPDESIFLALNSREYEYYNFRMLWKAGITFDFIGLTFGMTITTPSVGLYSEGRSGLNSTLIADETGDPQNDWLAADVQNEVSSEYKTPLSIGLGTTFKIDKTHIFVSAEWYSGINKYDVITPVAFTSQIGGDTLYNGVTHELADVLNFGIGVQHTLNPDLSINASFSTDFSARVPGTDTNLSMASWDIYNILVGASFRVLKSEFTVGIGYSYGEDSYDFSNMVILPIEDWYAKLSDIKFKYQNIKFVFGFTI